MTEISQLDKMDAAFTRIRFRRKGNCLITLVRHVNWESEENLSGNWLKRVRYRMSHDCLDWNQCDGTV